MLKIKLARFGKRKQPHYRIVINEARDKRDGKYTAQVGRYAPMQEPKILEFNVEAYKDWLTKGAQPTDTVAALFTRFESGNPFPPKKAKLSRKAKTKLAAAKEAAEEAKNNPVEEKPAEAVEVKEAAPEATPVTDAPVKEKTAEVKTEEKAEAPAK
ncbi:MAG: 30S ribosomal protein S16 [Candidatus Pacebacteria bacterium]|jgi:small subunit ribosomal protein S16|nr:30S ribosomal protein S16 [Candidatus Paceibacterota bacterium]MBT4652665.1 30S ribosomal protein S16 [Candidatus Paceibacterota bacterium]MBT6755822.1 30S ribosomal protein S16 [Candidatus Paceibacterota bacterium]MBT6921035.1 30S ribosomal protein S16 [Candidatus Paceibacterota bacterium]